jgi:hypothetical protein
MSPSRTRVSPSAHTQAPAVSCGILYTIAGYHRFPVKNCMLQKDSLGLVNRQQLARGGTCTLEELNERLSFSYSWTQVFAAVDRLNREGTVTLQRPDSSDYILSLAPRQSVEHGT